MNNIEHLLKEIGTVEEEIKSFEEQQIKFLRKGRNKRNLKKSIEIIYLKLRNPYLTN